MDIPESEIPEAACIPPEGVVGRVVECTIHAESGYFGVVIDFGKRVRLPPGDYRFSDPLFGVILPVRNDIIVRHVEISGYAPEEILADLDAAWIVMRPKKRPPSQLVTTTIVVS